MPGGGGNSHPASGGPPATSTDRARRQRHQAGLDLGLKRTRPPSVLGKRRRGHVARERAGELPAFQLLTSSQLSSRVTEPRQRRLAVSFLKCPPRPTKEGDAVITTSESLCVGMICYTATADVTVSYRLRCFLHPTKSHPAPLQARHPEVPPGSIPASSPGRLGMRAGLYGSLYVDRCAGHSDLGCCLTCRGEARGGRAGCTPGNIPTQRGTSPGHFSSPAGPLWKVLP